MKMPQSTKYEQMPKQHCIIFAPATPHATCKFFAYGNPPRMTVFVVDAADGVRETGTATFASTVS